MDRGDRGTDSFGSSVFPWSEALAAAELRVPGPSDDKYRRGVLAVRTGSSAYPGAAVLGVEAAWRTGIGLLRYEPPLDDPAPRFGLPTPATAVLAVRPETVFGAPPGARTDAWLIGSGVDPALLSAAERAVLAQVLSGTSPIVADAGALEIAACARAGGARSRGARFGGAHSGGACSDGARSDGARSGAPSGANAPPLILTPHAGEFAALWAALEMGPLPRAAGGSGSREFDAPTVLPSGAPWPSEACTAHGTGTLPPDDARHASEAGTPPPSGTSTAHGAGTRPPSDASPAPEAGGPRLTEALGVRAEAAATLASRIGATILLKGSTSLCATPSGEVFASGPATPWLATAGTGDVLAGILGSLVASRSEEVRENPDLLGPLGATAAHLHDAAARIAAGRLTATEPHPARPITALDVAHALPEAVHRLHASIGAQAG